MSDLDKIFRELGFPDPPPPMSGTRQKRPHPQKGPCGKSCYSSESAVKQAMRGMLKKGKTDVSRLRAYHCPECHQWHMTANKRF